MVCSFDIYLEKEALWLRASRDAVCYVAFPVLLSHSRQFTPEYSGARKTALIDLGCPAGERQRSPAPTVTPGLIGSLTQAFHSCLKFFEALLPSQLVPRCLLKAVSIE